MQLQSWNRFKTRALALEPELMGSAISFVRDGFNITIKVPPLERVGEEHEDDAPASRGAWNSNTGEVIYYHVHEIDVITLCPSEIALPDVVLTKRPNAYESIDSGTQAKLSSMAGAAEGVASSAFEYWIALLRWTTGSHRIGREVRVGSASGWSTYLHDSATDKPVWVQGSTFVIQGAHRVTVDEWRQALDHAVSAREPPMHVVLLGDARHCIDVGDYRRALVDLSVACEVYLRTVVLDSLPPGVQEEITRLIEEANINQFVAHLFPALLSGPAQQQYKKTTKPDLSALLARRNKLLHVAELEGATRESCERFRGAAEALFLHELRSKA